jgi:DNA polymerase alpha subunit p180 N terminal
MCIYAYYLRPIIRHQDPCDARVRVSRGNIAFGRVRYLPGASFRVPIQQSSTTSYLDTLGFFYFKECCKRIRFLPFNMSKASNARSKFAELRALRESGKKRLDTYQVHQEEDLYEEVDEDGYKKVVRERLNQDDFVIDDNGEGYADDGREEWDRRPGYDTESEEDLPVKGKSGKVGESSIYLVYNSH